MNPIQPVEQTTVPDEQLVARTVAGDRDAYRRIVERYKTLICSVAYNATGNIARSEDLAQETFIAGWKQIKYLREPARLRAWLCGIARNLGHNHQRTLRREPAHAAESLDLAETHPASDPLPSDETITREQEAILWRALERIPENYRMPLVLFYREHRSIARVAVDLDLSEDVVKQRLSRGRKLLHEQVLAFVEGALARTTPDETFTLSVVGALPLAAMTATTGGAAAMLMKLSVIAGAVIQPLAGVLLVWAGYKRNVADTHTPVERTFVKRRTILLLVLPPVFALVAIGLASLAGNRGWTDAPGASVLFNYAFVLAVLGPLAFMVLRYRRRLAEVRVAERRRHPELFATEARPASWKNFRSRAAFLGLPLLEIRFSHGEETQREAARAWVAIGRVAYGRLIAVGGFAAAPVAYGVVAVGLVTVGALSLGLLAIGGLAAGGVAVGPLATGVVATGRTAVAWVAAQGDLAVAHDLAVGRQAFGQHANDAVAHAFYAEHPMLDAGYPAIHALLHPGWTPTVVIALYVFWRYRRLIRDRDRGHNGTGPSKRAPKVT